MIEPNRLSSYDVGAPVALHILADHTLREPSPDQSASRPLRQRVPSLETYSRKASLCSRPLLKMGFPQRPKREATETPYFDVSYPNRDAGVLEGQRPVSEERPAVGPLPRLVEGRQHQDMEVAPNYKYKMADTQDKFVELPCKKYKVGSICKHDVDDHHVRNVKEDLFVNMIVNGQHVRNVKEGLFVNMT